MRGAKGVEEQEYVWHVSKKRGEEMAHVEIRIPMLRQSSESGLKQEKNGRENERGKRRDVCAKGVWRGH